MFSAVLQNRGAMRRYSVAMEPGAGWIVTLQHDGELPRRVRYRDWHRVERTLALFRLEISELKASGWHQIPSI